MEKLHFVGIGGIGMSALAAAAADCGCNVTGSDRGADRPENAGIIEPLRRSGIAIYPQDGSRFRQEPLPDTVVYSTAIEADNPDFAAAPALPRMHRSQLLGELLARFGKLSIAVTGSCGKSTVSCYLADVLTALGCDPVLIAGGLANSVTSDKLAGNYRPGRGKYLVFEADESDKSLLNYGADYAIILNIGTDHYEKKELARVFREFLTHSVRRGAVITRQVATELGELPPGLPVTVADEEYRAGGPWSLRRYFCEAGHPLAELGDGTHLTLPKFGRHMAVNALCILAMLEMLGVPRAEAAPALADFAGVWRRDDLCGRTAAGVPVYDDYAHNPEKILSCLGAKREQCTGRIFAVFQPHGYGPFGFMEAELGRRLNEFLAPGDRFILLEPYYAGGTSSFSPRAAEVLARWQAAFPVPERFLTLSDRAEVKQYLRQELRAGDLTVIMGARDNSLNAFAKELSKL